MLQTIHDKLKGIFAITILVALGIVFVFWGVDVSVGTFTKARGIEVNGQEVDVENVLRSYREQLSRYETAFAAAGVPEELRTDLQGQVLEQTVRTELIRQRTKKLRFETSDAAVLAEIRKIPAFQVGGQFSADAYHAALRGIALSPEQFEAEQRQSVIAAQLDRGIASSTFVMPAEFARQISLRHESRELAWVVLAGTAFTGSITLDEAALRAWYEANKSRFMTEEQATVEFVELNIESFAAEAAVDEATVREYYETNKTRYTTPGRRHARHILISSGDDDAAAEARAKAAYERARAGADFAALARELSDDAGSKESGGDLGWAQQSDFVGAFGDAVWSMKPGELHAPVKTEFGWHVIRLDEAAPEIVRSFDEVRAELEPELRRSEVENAFGDRQEELDTLAFESAGDLEAVATKLNLPIRRIEHFTRGADTALGKVPELIDAVFAADVLAGRELRTVELAPGRVIALGIVAHLPAAPRSFDEVRAQVAEAARLEQAQKIAAERATAVVAEMNAGTTWESATSAWQSSGTAPTHQPRLVRRGDAELPGEVATDAFRAPVPQGKPQFGAARLASGDTAIWKLTAVRAGSVAALSPEELQREQDLARQRAGYGDAAVYVASMRANADIDVNPQLFQ